MANGSYALNKAPSITFEGRAKIGGAPLFSDLKLHLPAASWTCLLGVSGVGKTTILRMIAGLDTGAELEGAISADDDAPLTGRVAYMAQSDLLLPWATVLENVCLGARLRGEKLDQVFAKELIYQVGLSEHEAKKPHALSGGQRQRAALARTLMEDRPVILLDEPFSALDARTRADMQELAHQMLEGRTVLLVTHEPGEAARLGDKIAVMTEDGLKEFEPPKEVPPRTIDHASFQAAQAGLFNMLRAV